MTETAIKDAIRDENLLLLTATAKLLDDAECVRQHHDRLMGLIQRRHNPLHPVAADAESRREATR